MRFGKYLIFILIVIAGLLVPFYVSRASILDFFYREKSVLSVSGNKLIFDNQEVALRGVSVGNPYSRVNVYYRDSEDYRVIKEEWKANAVRLSVHPGVYRRYGRILERNLEDEIAAARAQGMIVIVDWHVIGVPNGWQKPFYWGGSDSLYYNSDFGLSEDFWKYMAVKYRSDQGVMFEIWNEPQNADKNLSWDDIRDHMQRLHNLIRAQGAGNVVIAPGVYWSYDLRGIKSNPLKGDNIAYAWHNYPEDISRAEWEQALDGLYYQFPVLVTEWGFGSDKNNYHYSEPGDFGEKMKSFIIEKGLHFTAWCWHADWHPAMLEKNWRDTTVFGGFVKNFLVGFDHIAEVVAKLSEFIEKGIDYNTISLGRGERLAVVYSFKEAFGRHPTTWDDYNDVVKMANGRWPSQRSQDAEDKAKNNFRKIYLRFPNMNNQHDNAAVTVMAYGLRQKAMNRNLNSEAQALGFFRAIYGRWPSSTEDWNILQAITYSGATR